MSDLIHSQSALKPRVIPYLGDTDWEQIDRAQDLDPDFSTAKEKIEELGTAGVLKWLKDVPSMGCSLTQREYGELDFFLALANQTGETSIELSDLENTAVDICAYLTDADGSFIATLWYPKQRVAGFSITIGDPTAIIDRSFDLVGEKAILWQGANKYLIFKKKTIVTGDLGSANNVAITVENPSAVQDPDDSVYILRVVRIRSGVTTELITSQYGYSAPALSVYACEAGDVVKYWYTSGSWVTSPSVPFTTNSSDLGAIRANSASLYIGTSDYLYKVQSATIDVRFERDDVREIGNEDVILRGVRNTTVTITLGKLLDTDFSLEEILAGQAGGYGKIDFNKLSDDLTFVCAIYSDSAKDTFKIGFKATTLAPATHKPGTASIDTNVESGTTLEGENLLITTVENDLGIV